MQQNKTKIVFLILPLMFSLQRNYDVMRNWERFETGQLTVRLRQMDISAFTGQHKVTKMCPKHLLTLYYK